MASAPYPTSYFLLSCTFLHVYLSFRPLVYAVLRAYRHFNSCMRLPRRFRPPFTPQKSTSVGGGRWTGGGQRGRCYLSPGTFAIVSDVSLHRPP
ncbi:hypothetical protein F4818DRAFT_418803 [Hypoxylon cercidicola]|nr:hypothetical protein F4818DRAFT_418803 [Hypoxylon cercidicola]